MNISTIYQTKRIIIMMVALFCLSTIFAQTETRTLATFNKLKVAGALEVRLVQGQKNEVTISAPGAKDEDLVNLKTEIIDGELSVYRKGKIKTKGSIVVVVTFQHLNEIKQSGASDIYTLAVLREDNLRITGSGAIEADLNVEVKDLILNLSGASDIKLKGLANNFVLKSSGASDVKSANFIANHVVVDVSGASDVKVHAVESVKGKASGASSVNVAGSPKIKAINSGGASSVNVGNQHAHISEIDDVDVKLGNKGVVVKDDGDTVKVKWGHTELTVIGDSVELKRTPKTRRSHWAGVDLAINGFLNNKNSIDLTNDASTAPEDITQFMELKYSKSWSFAINFAEWYIPIHKHRFGLVTGLGTEWNNYELKHNIKLNPEGGRFVHENVDEFNQDYTWGEVDTVLNYSKNRFKTWFINAPLLLELNTGNHKNKSFHISAGAIFGFNLQTKMKYKYRLNGDNKKEKDKQDFNTNPFRVSATVRAGVGWFNVFATYSLTPLFENGRGPELYPFTVGVTLLGF
ncbi:MAG: GIN domain-containing protein [Vicingaceae bacterium]